MYKPKEYACFGILKPILLDVIVKNKIIWLYFSYVLVELHP